MEENDVGTFHLHPEFVEHGVDYHGRPIHRTFLCGSCRNDVIVGEIPSFSIAGGIDFGDHLRLGLTAPTDIERLLIARVRLYNRIFKFNKAYGKFNWQTEILKGHQILFESNSPSVVHTIMDSLEWHLRDLSNDIKVHSVGMNTEDIDFLIRAANKSRYLVGRTFVVYQWIAVLDGTNKLYDGYRDSLPRQQTSVTRKDQQTIPTIC